MTRTPKSVALLLALRAQLARDNAPASPPEASGMFAVADLLGKAANVPNAPPTLRSEGVTAWLVGDAAYHALTARVES